MLIKNTAIRMAERGKIKIGSKGAPKKSSSGTEPNKWTDKWQQRRMRVHGSD